MAGARKDRFIESAERRAHSVFELDANCVRCKIHPCASPMRQKGRMVFVFHENHPDVHFISFAFLSFFCDWTLAYRLGEFNTDWGQY
jgi:hypothetical protein